MTTQTKPRIITQANFGEARLLELLQDSTLELTCVQVIREGKISTSDILDFKRYTGGTIETVTQLHKSDNNNLYHNLIISYKDFSEFYEFKKRR